MTISGEPAADRSAHVDTFCRDNLPPRDSWPDLLFDCPELQYPARLNCARRTARRVIDRLGRDRPCLLAPERRPGRYGQAGREVATRSPTSWSASSASCRATGCCCAARTTRGWSPAGWRCSGRRGRRHHMPLLRAGELTAIAEIARVDLALCDARFVDDLVAADLGAAPVMTVRRPRRCRPHPPRRASSPATFDAVDTAADDVALLAFTSGTTGRPKATMHFHRDVLAIADTLRPARGPARRLTTCSSARPPLAFTFGLGGLVVFPLRAGAAMLLVEKATPAELADAIASARRDGLLHRADRLPRDARLGQRARGCARCAARCRPASTCPRPPGRRSATRPASS